jgi:lipoprotein-releasing system permease protein
MHLSLFLAGRFAFNKQKTFSRFIVRLATTATIVSVAAMILTLSFVNGFQKAVSEKVFHFWGHIRVQEFEPDKAIVAEETPVPFDDSVYSIVKQQKGVKAVFPFATKSAVIENNKEIEGVLLKGVEAYYDSTQLMDFLQAGRWIDFSDSLYSRQIWLSTYTAERLGIDCGDTVHTYFIQQDQGRANMRSLVVAGLYKTGIEEYDKLFAICDIRLLRRVYQWQHEEIGGFEIILNDYRQMDSVSSSLYKELPGRWISRTIGEVYPNIFDWLRIMNVNRNVIFIIMSVVAAINLVTCLLILILERTRMIGILKAMGSTDGLIRSIFLYNALFISGIGTFIGLAIGLGFSLLQQQFGLIKMNEAAYYVSVAPVYIVWWQVLLVCICTQVVCLTSLLLPVYLIKKISPVKAIRFS